MDGLPDVSTLAIHDPGPGGGAPHVPEDIANTPDHYMQKLHNYAKSLPYSIEPNSQMQQLLDLILLRIAQCVEAKDYDTGLLQWDSMLSYWAMLKYPIPKEKRIALAKLYFHVCTTPGMPNHVVAAGCDSLQLLTRSKKKLSIEDMRLPWKPIFKILSKDLFLTRRQFEISQTSWYMGYIAENTRRFFHPSAIDEMLSTFLPMMKGPSLSSILASQYYMLTFLPISHPQSYIPMLFRLWESINSYMFDDRMLQFFSRIAEMHVNPTVSDPRRIEEIPDDAREEDEGRPNWDKKDLDVRWRWPGLYSDVGIFSEHDWNFIMTKCLASMEIPLADAGSLTTGPNADNQASFELNRLPKPSWRISSLARIIVYSMAPDGVPTPASNAPTPAFTPFASRSSTPLPQHNGGLGDYLSAPLAKTIHSKVKTHLAGCKALDSLAKMIASVEGFFHPTNSGSWTNDLSAFVKYIVYEFNKRWHEEQQPDCKTPSHRRLTPEMRRELVKSLRTVVLLAMFSQDSTTVANVQSSLKSMSVMEPDLILHPVLERAVPALEALIETQRTIAVIKALGAVAPALVCRHVYYSGAKHLLQILELLLPGIDLNDPPKTFCTTAFIVEVAQYIKFGEMTSDEPAMPVDADMGRATIDAAELGITPLPQVIEMSDEARLTKEEEDTVLKNMSSGFADWVAAFLGRVILLFENLPEEGADNIGSTTEVQLVDAVSGAFSQICIHLSEPLYDMVLKMVFDYASENIRANAVRAIHQLVECVANADPVKTLAKFLPFCDSNIRTELEHGASSLRTTSSSSTPLPSDTTLHWNLAILRGAMYNDGRATLPYRKQLIALFKLLHAKTFSKRGFSASGKLISSTLLTLSHTYPLENKLVNPDEWTSEDFRKNHHQYWGKLYKPEDVKLLWHVPTHDEIDFALEIFREVIEPILMTLHDLLAPGVVRDAAWRNDFCRHLSFVRNAFSGIPTLAKEFIPPEEVSNAIKTSDILHEIPEMIATLEPLNAGFALTDPGDPRHQYIMSLKRRFGELLHIASESLRQQGEESTVDAVQMLIRSIRTYLLEYGDSRDNYYLQADRYKNEMNVARHYAGQKLWPRALYVRRARFYHSARLRWNSIERRRGSLEDSLIDDITEWAMWNYVTVREASQSLLDSLCNNFDGLRRRCLPKLYKALEPGTDDDRMKGALWTLNSSLYAKYAIGEPTLANEMLKRLFDCQHNERPSIQEYIASLAETCLNGFGEPCYVIYDIENLYIKEATAALTKCLQLQHREEGIVKRCEAQRVARVQMANASANEITETLLNIAKSPRTHWRYAIYAVRCLRTLIRRDASTSPSHIRYLIERTYDSNATMRYYAQRAIIKMSRYVKLRTLARTPVDLVLEQNHNPLRRKVPVPDASQEFTLQCLAAYREPLDIEQARREPLLCDKIQSGWIAWKDTVDYFLAPDATRSTFRPWDRSYIEATEAMRLVITDTSYWKKLSTHYAAENHTDVISQDNASCVKSIFQLFDNEPFEALKPVVIELLADKDKNKQRAAAELLAGLIGASKHWPTTSQAELWEWLRPHLKTVFGQQSNDTLPVWMTFFEYVFFNRDPRRLQPLVDNIWSEFMNVDFNGESNIEIVQVLCFFRAFYEELGLKFAPWVENAVHRCWSEISRSEHDDVLAYISELLTFSGKTMWHPNPSELSAEAFVRECRILSLDVDIMGIRGIFHADRIADLVNRFKIWREQRLPGARAFQSTYDRVGILVCKWLFQMIHDINAITTFDYILPLMPELCRFTELNDNDDLANRAQLLLVRMCGVVPPRPLINPMLDAIFVAIQKSPSWRVRLKIIPLVQVFYFRQFPLISDGKIIEMIEVICRCMDDEVVEVRESAATTLSGILRLSPRRSVLQLRDRFVRLLRNSSLPDRQSPAYNSALRQRHAAILGICALVDSYPYTVERWLPELLTGVLAEHTYDPIPISTTVRKCASDFKKTHQDTWHEDSKRFTDAQLAALSTLLTGSSYYA
ncbi:ARM repeat-containing protein [Wolfiporia cocos MD-104 SS10]|uniref:ARM repeat-containing protein n=1 Tax=Wolfiporia cocos (strain MD-104) TaxID=742152 RepID=A0A2H3ITU1_WOLCO|nr:ARM repeat-containing protein [Wolfiporia cocos MD-104 SS10]